MTSLQKITPLKADRPAKKFVAFMDKLVTDAVGIPADKAPFYLGNSAWSEKVLSARDREFLHEEAEEAQLVADLWKEPRGLLIVACNKNHFDRFWNKLGERGRFANVVYVDRLGYAFRGCSHIYFRLVLLPHWWYGHDNSTERQQLEQAICFFHACEESDKRNPPVTFNPKPKS